MSLINDKRRIIKELNDIKETIDCGTEDEYKKIYNACSADDDILDYLEEQNYVTSDDEDFLDCDDLIKITGLGRDNVRSLLRSKSFPTTKVGKRQVVSVLNFVTWLMLNNGQMEVPNA